jgi:uncharacterized protein (TIGR02145 family)
VILDAQVRIGGDIAPNAAAVLDLNANNDEKPAGNFGGFSLPRIHLNTVKQELNDAMPLNGTIVWNTNDDFYYGKGVYVWGDSVWVPIQQTLISNSNYQSVTTTPYVEIPSSSNPKLGLGMIFQVPTSYGDWSNTAQFIWEVTANGAGGYKPEILISGNKREMVFVPYDDTKRTYSARVKPIPNNGTAWDEWSELKVSAAGKYQGWYRLTGPTGYDIFKTPYGNSVNGRDGERTEMKLSNVYTVETVAGIEGTTTYDWTIVRNEIGALVSLGTPTNKSTVELIFNNGILTKDNLVNNPGVADTIVLQCTVNDGRQYYELRRTITVGDRDECSPVAGLLDAEGNRYTVSKFGGVCWMTQNLRSTWTRQGSQKQEIPKGYNESNDPKAVVYHYPDTYTAENLPDEYGFLYTWGAANIGTATTEDTNAFFGTTSDRQGICPDGWTLPSDYDWNQLEREIATNQGKYADGEITSCTWDSSYENNTGWRPGEGNSSSKWWGRTMKSNTKVKNANGDNVATYPNGVSKTDGTGFNVLLVGARESGSGATFGSYAHFWSSSAGSATAAWRRYLDSGSSGVVRYTTTKGYLYSVRCKKQ